MMPLSRLAESLLAFHARQPRKLIYGAEVLGTLFRDEGLVRLDAAYRELEEAGLLAKAGDIFYYFGSPKQLYLPTERGLMQVQESRNAGVH